MILFHYNMNCIFTIYADNKNDVSKKLKFPQNIKAVER